MRCAILVGTGVKLTNRWTRQHCASAGDTARVSVDFCMTCLNQSLGHYRAGRDLLMSHPQKIAWLEQISILNNLLRPYSASEGAVILEYEIPRLGRRVDTLLLLDQVLFVLEFKVGAETFSRDAIDQVWDYALDLKNFARSQP